MVVVLPLIVNKLVTLIPERHLNSFIFVYVLFFSWFYFSFFFLFSFYPIDEMVCAASKMILFVMKWQLYSFEFVRCYISIYYSKKKKKKKNCFNNSWFRTTRTTMLKRNYPAHFRIFFLFSMFLVPFVLVILF